MKRSHTFKSSLILVISMSYLKENWQKRSEWSKKHFYENCQKWCDNGDKMRSYLKIFVFHQKRRSIWLFWYVYKIYMRLVMVLGKVFSFFMYRSYDSIRALVWPFCFLKYARIFLISLQTKKFTSIWKFLHPSKPTWDYLFLTLLSNLS